MDFQEDAQMAIAECPNVLQNPELYHLRLSGDGNVLEPLFAETGVIPVEGDESYLWSESSQQNKSDSPTHMSQFNFASFNEGNLFHSPEQHIFPHSGVPIAPPISQEAAMMDIDDSEEFNLLDASTLPFGPTPISFAPTADDENSSENMFCKKSFEPQYRCTIKSCSAKFEDRALLVKHSRTHTGEKPHLCTHPGCGKRFSHRATLKEHMNIHAGTKPYVCTHANCTKSFANSSNLSRHTRIHTGEKPYGCPDCTKAFSQSGNLKAHVRAVHHKNISSLSDIGL